jgi:hypothetical protein
MFALESPRHVAKVRHVSPSHPHPAKKPSHVKESVRLVVYPGEWDEVRGGHTIVTMGTVYVLQGRHVVDQYQVAGGPKKRSQDRGHWAVPTTAGDYVLGPRERHTTSGWHLSAIPWGAALRENSKGDVEYQVGGKWFQATGPHGRVTTAFLHSVRKTGLTVSPRDADAAIRENFYPARNGHKLLAAWDLNDFGRASFNLRREGKGTVFYFHSTAADERNFSAAGPTGPILPYIQSHGCLRLQPTDREEMIRKSYLGEGVHVTVMPYNKVGPPPAAPVRPHP